MPQNTGPMQHPPGGRALSPREGIEPPTPGELKPLVVARGAMSEGAWFGLCQTIQTFQSQDQPPARVGDGRLEFNGPVELDTGGTTHLAQCIKGLVATGQHSQVCDWLEVLAPATRAHLFLSMNVEDKDALKDHADEEIRQRFQRALFGVAAHACRHMNEKFEYHDFIVEQVSAHCSAHSLAKIALLRDDWSGFWSAYRGCSREDKRGLAYGVPDAVGGLHEVLTGLSTEDLFGWVRQNIEAGFDASLSAGMGVCATWLDRAEGLGDPLRRAILRSAVAHALTENAPAPEPPSVQLGGWASLLERAWACELTPDLLDAVPEPCRERLLSAAVQRAANADTAHALNGLVACYLALCDEPQAHADDRLWLGECLRSAFKDLLASDSGLDERARAEVQAMQARLDRGVPQQLARHLQEGCPEKAADGIAELCWLAGPGVALEHFDRLAQDVQALLKTVGLTYGLTGQGLQIHDLPEEDDEALRLIQKKADGLSEAIQRAEITWAEDPRHKTPQEQEQHARELRALGRQLDRTRARLTTVRSERRARRRPVLQRLLGLLERCGLGENHPLEGVVRQHLDSGAVPPCANPEGAGRQARMDRLRAHVEQLARRAWRPAWGAWWETRHWIDQLLDLGLGAFGCGVGQALSSAEFDGWLRPVVKDQKASGPLLAGVLAAAMDGEACGIARMVWLFERFADGLDLRRVLVAMPPSLQSETPVSGVDRFLRIASRLMSQRDWLADGESHTHRWQPGWRMLLDFCRFVAAKPDPASTSMERWFIEFCLGRGFEVERAEGKQRRAFLEDLWVRALVNGLTCPAELHARLMDNYLWRERMQIHLWDHDNQGLFLSLMEPPPGAPTGGPAPVVLLRHNLAKGLLRCGQALNAARVAACAPSGSGGPAFQWAEHWASALVTACREVLSQPNAEAVEPGWALNLAALWTAAAETFPQWLDTAIGQHEAIWVKAMVGLFTSTDMPGEDKPQALKQAALDWREALLSSQAQ